MSQMDIEIRGAREHNLQNVSLTLPRNQLIVMSGVSGSGKSSLAFDTLYAEGQRRYVESLSTYARQFLGQMPKPDVDSISGIAPCISIQQKTAGRNPRSTVGTMTEIYDYLRVLFARVGQGYCYVSGLPIKAQPIDRIVESILKLPQGTRFSILAPIVQNQKGEFKDLFIDLLKKGFVRARVDGEIIQLNEPPALQRHYKHHIEVVIDRLVAGSGVRNRVAEAVSLAVGLANGLLIVVQEAEAALDVEEATQKTPTEKLYSTKYACPESGMSYDPPTPQLFSFNSPLGMCLDCNGLGTRHEFDLKQLIHPELSIANGAIDLVGPMKGMGRWRRHIYQGIAEAIEKDLDLPTGSFLKTTWSELPAKAHKLFLYGMGERLITFTWRRGRVTWKHGDKYAGVIAELMTQYREIKSPPMRAKYEKLMQFATCSTCEGTKLNAQARFVRITSGSELFKSTHKKTEINLPEVCALTISEAMDFFDQLTLDETGQMIAEELLKEIRGRLGFLLRCGLDYLTLDRQAPTLSGGESQRIRLAGQIGCGLVGVIYVLDEPSIGLHPRDNTRLLESLCDLRNQGNTVIVVEHDEETMRAADYMVDFGPGPGHRGGQIVARGSVEDVMRAKDSITGKFLSGEEVIAIPAVRNLPGEKEVVVKGATHHNLKQVDVQFPLERLVCVTGVSGSGKSSLVNDILWQVLHQKLNKGDATPGAHETVEGLEHLDKAIDIDQSPIGRTPRSNPATYTKLFDLIRDLFTQLPGSKLRGYSPGRFSFNVKGGRCEKCEGNGATRLEMDFLADVWVTCPVCNGQRFNQETLEVKFKDYNIAQVLDLEVGDALTVFENVPKIKQLLQTLHDVGLDYLKLGQPSPTLSGGEAQRIKLARELGKRSTGKTIYLLDEPTTGLHFVDVRKLIEVMHHLVAAGNTVIVVEHNLDVIKSSDWVIDMGLEGGAGGGRVIIEGTPEDVARHPESYTGHALSLLPDMQAKLAEMTVPAVKKGSKKTAAKSKVIIPTAIARKTVRNSTQSHGRWQSVDDALAGKARTHITIRGAKQHNLQDVDVDLPRDQMLVLCGPSGSGKSSLAMDTLYAEGQRRYVESLSSYARQFLGQMPKPQVEQIRGLSPAIAIEQKTVGSTPRSTIGTVTEIYDYLRVLFARLGTLYCPDCNKPVVQMTTDQVVDQLLAHKGQKALILAPITLRKGETFPDLWQRLQTQGYIRVRVQGKTYTLDNPPKLGRKTKQQIDIVIDRVTINPNERARLTESVEAAMTIGGGVINVAWHDDKVSETDWTVDRYSRLYSCDHCGRSFDRLKPQNFSFNHPLGWCPTCEGLGVQEGGSYVLMSDPTRSLEDNAIEYFPDLLAYPMFKQMLEAVVTENGHTLTEPLNELSPHLIRVLFSGDEQQTYQIPGIAGLKFEWKGLYPTLSEASRVSYSHRQKLYSVLGQQTCSTCHGARVKEEAAHVRVRQLTLQQLCLLPLEDSLHFLKTLTLNKDEQKIAGELLLELTGRLDFLVEVGLDYLTLDRSMPTLSGGESQRIRLAGQLGRSLTGVLYVLDEPTIGLHPRDNKRLLKSLKRLRDLGNTVVLVEHDREVIEAADCIYDFGPGSGQFGGKITASGPIQQLEKQEASLTGQYLSGRKEIVVPQNRRIDSIYPTAIEQVTSEVTKTKAKATKKKTTEPRFKVAEAQPRFVAENGQEYPWNDKGWLQLIGARHHNLRDVDLNIPLGTFTCITGVSGSGKSSLIMETLAPALQYSLRDRTFSDDRFDRIAGETSINKVVIVDQQPLGNTPASNPATFTGIWEEIRVLYEYLPDAKIRGFKSSRFSFNRPGGRCEDCEGLGQKCVEMHFLPDVWVECATCRGQRFNQETLEVKFQGHTIADVLNMSVSEALKLFDGFSKIRGTLAILNEMGLGYLKLGQSAPTLSGGEAQRIKLAAELARPQYGKTLYLLDEPTTGLHFDDIVKLLRVLDGLVEQKNTIVVIEHNLDVIKSADWVVDIGPEAGAEGGFIVAEGTPEDLVEHSRRYQAEVKQAGGTILKRSYTGELLGPVLENSKRIEREALNLKSLLKPQKEIHLHDLAEEQQSPWETDGRRWHTKDRRSHTGKTCQWDGSMLANVIDILGEYDNISEPNWNHRSIVEVKHTTHQGSWFLHALTGDEWILTLNFRMPKRAITQSQLDALFPLKSLDQIDHIPRYTNSARASVSHLKGPLQEVTLKLYKADEFPNENMQKFLDIIVPSFESYAEKLKSPPKKSRKAAAAEEDWDDLYQESYDED
jgi:excinuclease ABC subunit A